ncbi:MAG: DEAD/DEAH box helicase [Terriglobales bacterium]
MPYFSDHYGSISYPVAEGDARGLYNAQLGAAHALAAHYTVDDRPAIVTMPTGSGKTAVLMILPFILRSRRVLVVTPSRLVRGQIAEDFSSLRTLREIGVVPDAIERPRVKELADRINSADGWDALRQFDVVVSAPNCISPGYLTIPAPPPDLFDLVIIDEAHHSPAFTWAALLDAFQSAKRALFTATPYRRDRAEIKGRFVYNYPITRAFHDHIFGRISYVPVDVLQGENQDAAIARTANEVFQTDRASGLNHYLMVRTDRKTRAEELAIVYSKVTPLRLRVVHSSLSNKTVKGILAEMNSGSLDGVICVNMMGEGFNFPRLKIAAVHSPHKSLEVTLQFIGRFARTNAPDIGEAKFVALLSDIEIERKRIFDEGAVWQEIIPQLSYGRIADEIHTKEVLEEFHTPAGAEEFADLSLYSLNPRSHVKIYDVSASVDFRHLSVELPSDQELCYRNVNDAGDSHGDNHAEHGNTKMVRGRVDDEPQLRSHRALPRFRNEAPLRQLVAKRRWHV